MILLDGTEMDISMLALCIGIESNIPIPPLKELIVFFSLKPHFLCLRRN
jgi:hypothetical protein